MGDARAKGAGRRSGRSQHEVYFQLSTLSAEEARLRAQLAILRGKEQLALSRLETLAQQMARLNKELDSIGENSIGEKQPNKRGDSPRAWDVIELRY